MNVHGLDGLLAARMTCSAIGLWSHNDFLRDAHQLRVEVIE